MASTELRQEGSVSSKNPYAWFKSSEPDISLDHFLTKYRPSMVRDDGTKPWLRVRAREPSEESTVEGETAAIAQAAVVLEQATEKVQSIQNDASIPVRSNKKTGAKSKKEVQAEAAEKLKEIAIKNGYTCGKWLVFASSEKVDSIWSSVARSLVDGPLSKTAAFCTKVATCPADEKPNYQHVLCIYMPNVYDKDAVTEVIKVLLRHHGLKLSGVKPDLYTDLSIDSKHPSGIPSTIWKATSLMKDTEIKGGTIVSLELRGAFFDELAAKPKDSGLLPMPNEQEKSSETAQPDEEKPKPKPKAKLKKMQKDTFVSDDDEEDAEEEEKRKEELKKKMAKTRKRDDSDDEEKPKKKTAKM
ncbi:translation initiation factor eIF 4e-like domain-containing protein [Armillaria borealis]|uniref:Translation initiation factor eIF 4e-like domain-containing protein n=1 Tax=Armillaria borealis TaxID=47425 RepID=A0AA39K9F9_9AGAR|nr:translation initiation factor eIF 4e-like domain-containing protein [Armillaria borealis]